jgi:aromatic-L-amino-acid/L-tryptophan decarboxylase
MNTLDISSDQFRRLAEHVTRLAADYLQNLDSRSIPPGSSGKETEALFHTELPEKGLGEDALIGLEEVIRHSRAQNGRFFGYVLGSGEPVGATADLLASVLNQNVTAWRSAPAAVAIERTVNGKAGTFTVVSSSEITTTLPASATTGEVQVVTPGGTLSSNVPFMVLP